MQSFKTKKGTVVTIDEDTVRVGDKAVHIGHFQTLNESPDRAYWIDAFRRGKRDVSEIGLVATTSICIPKDGNDDLIKSLSDAASSYRAKVAAKNLADEKFASEERKRIAASVPAGFEIATKKSWLDGICTFEASDGATTSAWDDTYKSEGQGLVYIPTDCFSDSRKERTAKSERAIADAAERKAKEDAAQTQSLTTGKPAALRKWTTERCMNGNDSECSFDNAIEWVMPDGSRKTTYTCCF